MRRRSFLTGSMIAAAVARTAPAQAPARPRTPAYTSPEVSPDRQITFRIYAPHSQEVRLFTSDVPGMGPQKGEMTKGDDGIWQITIGPINPGAYRYNFNVDGVSVIDPRSASISESNTNVWSLVYVPGSDFMDTTDVPHGAVAAVTYYSKTLSRYRRMHVYTPPGYETNREKYPVFYLLHGAGDCDESWTSVGRAGFIMDNLIAAKKAKPMVIVMPAGHTGPFTFGPPAPGARAPRLDFNDDFVKDFSADILPYAESHYRIIAERPHRAIAGLSMGGAHTLNIAIPHLNEFAYIGVFSSGIFGIVPRPGMEAPEGPSWEEQHQAELDDASLKKGLKLFWFATGKDDGLLSTSQATVAMLKKHGFDAQFTESDGAHTWINWRDYLNEFAPKLFV